MRRERRDAWYLKTAKQTRNIGILLKILLVRKCPPNYILRKHLQLHSLQRHLPSQKGNKQMTVYEAICNSSGANSSTQY